MTFQDTVADAAAEAPPVKNGFSPISSEKLQQLYATMLQCRMLEERVGQLYGQGKLQGSYAVSGQEAAVAGIVLDMLPEDTLGLFGRDLMAPFMKRVPLEALLQPLFAQAAGADAASSAPEQVGYASLNVLAQASTLDVLVSRAAKVAQANKKKNNGRIVVMFCGAEPVSQDSWHKTLKLANVQELPMVFVCQSGLESESEKRKPRRLADGCSSKAQEHGMPRIPVDGCDVVAVYRVASEAMSRARKGSGPTIIECQTFGLSELTGIDFANERPGDKAQRQESGDPILKMEKYLTGKGLFRANQSREAGIQFSKDLDAAIALAERPPRPQGM